VEGLTMMKRALIRAIDGMTEEQAVDLYHAVAQWADNQRNWLDEVETGVTADLGKREWRELRAAELIEHAGDAFMAQLAEVSQMTRAGESKEESR
jgi:hypothetical protein